MPQFYRKECEFAGQDTILNLLNKRHLIELEFPQLFDPAGMLSGPRLSRSVKHLGVWFVDCMERYRYASASRTRHNRPSRPFDNVL